jgi:glycosyltransferase involved in cell wall biosynthesis
MKIYYIANARMPNEKAHGIQIAKMCEAFVALDVSLELVVSSRGSGSLSEAYGLTRDIPLQRLPVLDLQFFGPVGYRLTAFQFVCGALFFLWWKVFLRERFIVYTVDMDPFSYAPLVWIPRPVFAEMHGVKKPSVLVRNFFKRAGIIATNNLIGEELARAFNIPPARICIEPNGVDESLLQDTPPKEEARRSLGLPPDEPFALYVGRFYAWKGLEILADAANYSHLPIYLVGGTREEYERVTKRSGENLHFAGAMPVMEVPLWLAAADVVLVLGTAQNEDSYRHTSPMKIFEYLAAGRPVVASRTPANSSIIGEDAAFWYEPDDAHSLVQWIREAYASPEAPAKVAAGNALAATHTWRQRARRILSYMHAHEN